MTLISAYLGAVNLAAYKETALQSVANDYSRRFIFVVALPGYLVESYKRHIRMAFAY